MTITDVIFDRETNKVLVMKIDDVWLLPTDLELAHFEGAEPVFYSNEYGEMFIKDNAFILRNGLDSYNDDNEDDEYGF